jgi:DNA helicase-2/ATP-dependent DNA helicase PcrA
VTIVDPVAGSLTAEQKCAAASRFPNLFIEAEPGSGKTSVAAQRFGVLRYLAGLDERAVLAISFTRSATAELRSRVQRIWGPSANQWPHEIGTIDSLMRRLVRALLIGRHVEWIGGHVDIDVIDDWRTVAPVSWSKTEARVGFHEGRLSVTPVPAQNKRRAAISTIREHVGSGICTHDDIRSVLSDALEVPELAQVVKEHLSSTTRALIIDEIFDANGLDLQVFELALAGGVEVTIIGDPWQALYGFRGARPQDVPLMVERTGIRQLPLTASFRWQTEEQRDLAGKLRDGSAVIIPEGPIGEADVALAGRWGTLWAIDSSVLPVGYTSYGDNEEGLAAETLLLNQMTRNTFQIDAPYLAESLKVLGIPDLDVRRDLEDHLNAIVVRLRNGENADSIHQRLSACLAEVAGRPLIHPVTHDDRERIELLRSRVIDAESLVPGMTIHQAKGREWNHVAVRLSESEQEALGRGLSHEREPDRMTYVACTRARKQTFLV